MLKVAPWSVIQIAKRKQAKISQKEMFKQSWTS